MKKVLFLVLTRSFLFGLCCVVSALIFNRFSPEGIPLINPAKDVLLGGEPVKIPIFQSAKFLKSQGTQPIDFQPAREITLTEASQYFRSGKAIFIDARSSDEYEMGHITRAVSIPLQEFESRRTFFEQFPLDQLFIVYCAGVHCSESIELAIQLEQLNFGNVCFYPGGYDKWVEADYPTWKGEKP